MLAVVAGRPALAELQIIISAELSGLSAMHIMNGV